MSILKRLALCCLVAVALVGAIALPSNQPSVSAQGDAVVCDSTLAILILMAEYNYDYLSHMMMDEEMMASMPTLDFGQYQPVIDSVVAMMMEEEMMEEEGDMTAHDEMLANFMAMDTAGMVAAYEESMGMAMGEGMTVLNPGNVVGEDPVCAEVRANVEKFLLAHLLTEMSMMGDDM